jgi:hypothetical protein
MFVSIGFDDNSSADGMNWAMGVAKERRNPDRSAVTISFYSNTVYSGTAGSAWKSAQDAGHEVGNHTDQHQHGAAFTVDQWTNEISTCTSGLNGLGIDEVYGFRTPFLEYNEATFTALNELGIEYDCSIEEGYQPEQDGTNYAWPHTLDEGSPGNDVLVEWGLKDPIGKHPGLWEMPVHPVIVPPDEECEKYGVPTGFRDKMKSVADYFDVEGGKITGLDYNMYATGMFLMNKAEFVATLKYTFDLRYNGNRAPMMFGAHSQYYSSEWNSAPNMTLAERQAAIEEFLDYVLKETDTRVVSIKEILEWCKDPQPL